MRANSRWTLLPESIVIAVVSAVAILLPALPGRAENPADAAAAEDAEAPMDFSRDIRPILSNTCFKCHGPDEAERQAGLRLDTPDGATAKLDSGEVAIQPGSLPASALYQRITSDDPDLRMPPPDEEKQLTADQIKAIGRWISSGASWQQHWSFVAPQRPAVPQVAGAAAEQNPIDAFIQAKLKREKLKPSAEADKVTLIRRVTLDLTGLPPTPQEVDAFLKDESPQAYERLVNRLLQSPRYGEHMARYWLDAARYGDTHGLHLDNERSLWPYREWVIDSFNNNKPFDEFTIEQLGGDLLENPTLEQRVATGFNRCNVTTSEGGSIAEEYRVRYAVDRVETTATVWMGLTAGCAVCHDHKYDPISQREFYGLFAFFNNVTENPMDGNALLPPPTLKLPTEEHNEELKKLNTELAALNKQISDRLAKVEYVDPQADQTEEADKPQSRKREDFVWIEDDVPQGAKKQGNWNLVSAPDFPVFSGKHASRETGNGMTQHFFTQAPQPLVVGGGDTLFAYVFLDLLDPPKQIMLQFNDGTWEHRAFWGEDQITFGTAGTPGRFAAGELPELNAWVRLEVKAADVGLKPGTKLNGWAFTQFGGTVTWDKAGIVTRTPQDAADQKSLIAWEAAIKSNLRSLPTDIQNVLKIKPEDRKPGQQQQVLHYFLQHVYTPLKEELAPINEQHKKLTDAIAAVEKSIPSTMVMADMPQPRETFVLLRGQYDKPGDKVEAGVPAVLPPLPADAPRNRLTLARWLVDPSHPLTARVTVNRFWQQYFGQGLVETAEDFGSQGAWPTHPELLDFLAVEFIESGWDVKHMQRLIVTSATYRQSSEVTPQLQQRDPQNLFLARGPRFRLDAETIRDQALYVSGLLIERQGGKSVKPYQPEGLWEAVGYTNSNTANFVQDHGDALYRRSMYTFWKRTSPPPSMSAFDAPSREACTVRRARTNTPLQALCLMNDVQYVEAARHFAERIIESGGDSADARLQYAFRLVVSRKPSARELSTLQRFYESMAARYAGDKEAASALLSQGESPRDESLPAEEVATWTMVANLLLNLNETITKP